MANAYDKRIDHFLKSQQDEFTPNGGSSATKELIEAIKTRPNGPLLDSGIIEDRGRNGIQS